MAKRSDFAQKLLDDLRVRKERMAASQSSKSTKPMAGDAYSYTKQAYRGSREMKTPQLSGFKNGTTRHKPTGGNKSLAIGESSKDIVPFGRGRSSEQIGDLSMALAFALENGGKLRRTDSSGNSSMLGFLNQIGRASVDMGKMERSSVNRHSPASSPFPTISQLHIEEISRGAQKLNLILRACSNGLNFDRYSIEIGKELLKGAMDLEDSLRMLVNLQEASEYMIAPQSKTQITLLDEEEDDDNTVKTAMNNQLARPIFSFDKPSRNTSYIQEAVKADLKQRLMALTYQSETKNFSHDTHVLNSTFHEQSTTYSPNVKTLAAFSEQKNYSSPSKSKTEKGRIPNVIAKLMGLEKLPENVDSKYITKKEFSSKGPSSKEKTERKVTKKTAEGNTAPEQKTKDAGNLVSEIRKHKQIQPNQIQVAWDMTHAKQAERNLASHHASFEEIVHDGKPLQKNVQGIKQMRSSNKAKMKINKHQSHTDQSNQSIGSQKDIQEKDKRQENKKLRDQNGKEKGETKELILKHQLQQVIPQTQNGSEAGSLVQAPAECNLTMPKTERRDTHKLPFNNRPSSPNDLAFQQSHMFHNSESQYTKHHAGERKQQTVKQKIQVRKQTGGEFRSSPKAMYESPNFPKKNSYRSQETPTNGSSTTFRTMQSAGFPNKRHHVDLVQDKISDFIVNMQDSLNMNSNQNSSERNLHFEVIKEKNRTIIPSDTDEKPVHLPAVQKVKVTKAQKAEAPRKIDELVTRRIGNPHSLARPPKQQISTLQEVKQKRHNELIRPKEEEQVRSSRLKEAERCIVKSNKSSKEQSNVSEQLQSRADQASNFCCPLDDECKSLKGPVILAPNENLSTVINVQQGQEPDFSIDKLRSHSIVIESLNRTHEGRIDIAGPLQLESEKVHVLERVEPLTESENHLKQILIKSQLFLSRAEALFKLNISLDILDVSGYNCHDEEGKFILDCGYEVLKRKGKRQELSVHPFMRKSITSMKVRSVDNLVKQLHKDFEKLRFYSTNDIAECVVEDYLPKMLEIDVYNRNPDVNCMWDFGWHEMMFTFLEKDDVIRDVEKHMLNSLLDEVTRDLVLVF